MSVGEVRRGWEVMGRDAIIETEAIHVDPGNRVVAYRDRTGATCRMVAPGARVVIAMHFADGRIVLQFEKLGDVLVGTAFLNDDSKVALSVDQGGWPTRTGRWLVRAHGVIWDGMVAGCVAAYDFVPSLFRKRR